MSFLSELRRRNVFRMAGLYLVGAWLVVQVASTLLPVFGAPAWVMKALVLMLALLFVPALLFSWIYELTPTGLVREAEAKPEPAFATRTRRRLEGTIVIVLALALLYFGFDRFVLARGRPAGQAAAATPADSGVAAPVVSPKSIAVLAFTDLSPAHDQEYFSDGMAEELLNALAQVKDLRVAGRTSSFYYKGRNEDLRRIGRALGVANILEGSVRKQGDRVRITAQLIRASDDTHLWSHAYDGDLSDVFKLQEHIARAITDQLQVVLEDGQKTRLVQIGTTNPEAYTLYLQATAALNQRDFARMGQAIGWLERAIQLDPKFARAHSRLAMIHVLGQARYGSSLAEAERHARVAMALDPTLAEPLVALSLVARYQRRYLAARSAMDRALALAPEDADVLLYDAQLLIVTGYTRAGIAQLDHALAVDPMLPNALNWRAQQYTSAGDPVAAERMLDLARNLGLSFANAALASLAMSRHDYVRARVLFLPYLVQAASCLPAPKTSMPIFAQGAYGGDAAARTKSLAVINECLAARPDPMPLWVPIGLMLIDQPDRALDVLGRGPTSDDASALICLWASLGQEARQSPGFADFARKVGFTALWDRYGAPDLCRKKERGDYVCR